MSEANDDPRKTMMDVLRAYSNQAYTALGIAMGNSEESALNYLKDECTEEDFDNTVSEAKKMLVETFGEKSELLKPLEDYRAYIKEVKADPEENKKVRDKIIADYERASDKNRDVT